LPVHAPTEKFFPKNTIDLQWKMRANYNVRLCASLRKAASAGTMENNEKNNEKKQYAKHAEQSDAWLDARKQGDGAARRSPPSRMRPFAILVMPGGNEKPAGEERRATVAQIGD
jgi:hypothetical protein